MKSKAAAAILLFVSSGAMANQCPNLAGNYACVYPNSKVYKLDISQKNAEDDVTIYSFLYPEISSVPEEVRASDQGVSDGMGWTVACSNNKLFAVTLDGARVHEYYIDSNGNYVSGPFGAQPVLCYRSSSHP